MATPWEQSTFSHGAAPLPQTAALLVSLEGRGGSEGTGADGSVDGGPEARS